MITISQIFKIGRFWGFHFVISGRSPCVTCASLEECLRREPLLVVTSCLGVLQVPLGESLLPLLALDICQFLCFLFWEFKESGNNLGKIEYQLKIVQNL